MQDKTSYHERFLTFTALIAFALCTVGIVGCNTMEGAGKDIEEAGEAIQEGAEDDN